MFIGCKLFINLIATIDGLEVSAKSGATLEQIKKKFSTSLSILFYDKAFEEHDLTNWHNCEVETLK